MDDLVDQGKFPLALQNKPKLPIYLSEYYEAFWVISHGRSVGMGIGSIPVSEILAYLQIFPTDDPALFVYLIYEMDEVYLERKRNG